MHKSSRKFVLSGMEGMVSKDLLGLKIKNRSTVVKRHFIYRIIFFLE